MFCSFIGSYDDGEVEWIDSTKEQFELLESKIKDSKMELEAESEDKSKMEVELNETPETKSEISTQNVKECDAINVKTTERAVSPTERAVSPTERAVSPTEQTISTNNTKSVGSRKSKQINKSTDSDDAYQPNSNGSDDNDDDDDIPIAKLRRFIVSDSDSDSDAPILSKKTTSKSVDSPSAPRTPTKRPAPSSVSVSVAALSSSPASTPSKLMRSTSTPNSTPKRQRTSEAGLDEDKLLEKKGAVILNAGEHAHDNIEWMIHPRDKYNHLPSDPNYDPTSFYVPPAYLKECTNGMKQWWAVKQQTFDCILLMKVGKFYETYHMDADILVKVCDLVYMKGETAHAGFPEAAYSKFSNQLVDANYRVARVEQTETPQQLKERNAISAKKESC